MLPVTEVMQNPCEAVDCDASLDEVATAMHVSQSMVIPVVRGDLPLGVVSRRDIGMLKLQTTLCDIFGEDMRQEATSVLAIAASSPSIRPGERLSQAASLMVEHRRQAIAVVNQAGRLLGVLTDEMILRSMLDSMRS